MFGFKKENESPVNGSGAEYNRRLSGGNNGKGYDWNLDDDRGMLKDGDDKDIRYIPGKPAAYGRQMDTGSDRWDVLDKSAALPQRQMDSDNMAKAINSEFNVFRESNYSIRGPEQVEKLTGEMFTGVKTDEGAFAVTNKEDAFLITSVVQANSVPVYLAEMLTRCSCPGLLDLTIVRTGDSLLITHDTSGYIRYGRFFKLIGGDLKTVFTILERCALTMESCRHYLLLDRDLCLNENTIYINPDNRDVRFLYTPAEPGADHEGFRTVIVRLAAEACARNDNPASQHIITVLKRQLFNNNPNFRKIAGILHELAAGISAGFSEVEQYPAGVSASAAACEAAKFESSIAAGKGGISIFGANTGKMNGVSRRDDNVKNSSVSNHSGSPDTPFSELKNLLARKMNFESSSSGVGARA